MAEKKAQIRDYLSDFCLSTLKTELADLNDVHRSRLLTRYYVINVLAPLSPSLVPDDEEDLEACFTDATNDCGVDFISRSAGHVTIVQSKFRSRNIDEDPESLEYFFRVLRRLHPQTGRDDPKNEKLLNAISDIDWEADTFELQYLTTGKAGPAFRRTELAGPPNVPEIKNFEDRVSIRVLDGAELNTSLRDALEAADSIRQQIPLRFARHGGEAPWLTYENSEGKKCYIGRISSKQLFELYKRWGTRLFNLNIRNYVGSTSTNKAIVATAREEGQNFFFYNNGIAAVATGIDDSNPPELKCDRLSIINGAQTVRSLHKALLRSNESGSADQADILIRVSEVSFKDNEDERSFLDNITKFNNTQNPVKISDFRSNDPVQRALTRQFASLSRKGKKFAYKAKRSERPDTSRIPIGLEEFAKTIHAFRIGPADMFGGTSYLFDTEPGGGYAKVYGVDDDVPPQLSEAQFRELAGIWFLCEQIREQFRFERTRQEQIEHALIERLKGEDKDPVEPVARQALERRWLVYFTVAELLRERYRLSNIDMDADLLRLANPEFFMADTERSKAIASYTRTACETLTRVFRTARSKKDFLARNWFRDEKTLTSIQLDISSQASALESKPLLAS